MTRDSRRRLQQHGDVQECLARQVLVALEEAQGGHARCEHFEVYQDPPLKLTREHAMTDAHVTHQIHTSQITYHISHITRRRHT